MNNTDTFQHLMETHSSVLRFNEILEEAALLMQSLSNQAVDQKFLEQNDLRIDFHFIEKPSASSVSVRLSFGY